MEAGRRAVDFSIRAIDAYRKTLLIDKLTSGDERSPPVYLLNEISDILRSCSLDLTQEIVEYTFRRLRHHNPQVKYKVLRFIKYTVNRSGSAAYRKELQSYSASIRELFNFQGQLDPLKGNALNQAVRDAAHEAIKGIFSSDTDFPAPKHIKNRIEGFGNGNLSKSLIDETERGNFRHHDGNHYLDSVACKQDRKIDLQENVNGKLNRESKKASSPEEKLLDKVTASEGFRLQPTHECLKFFLASVKTLDAARVAFALKAKLRCPSWQVRLKALCLLQALLDEKDANLLDAIEADEGFFHDCVQECLVFPQTTLRKKAKEVFDSLQAVKKAKAQKGSTNMLLEDPLPVIKSSDKACLTSNLSLLDDRDASFLHPSSATTSDIHKVVDLLSFQSDNFALVPAAETSINSVMDDAFVGMCIYGSGESTKVHEEDCLSGGWTDNDVYLDLLSGEWTNNGVLQVEAPFGSVKKGQNDMVLRIAPQSNTMKQNLPALNHNFTTGKSATYSKTILTDTKENTPDLQNLDGLYVSKGHGRILT